MENEVYDVIVIGGGAMGSSSAYNLAKRGQKVLLLEQFEFMHNRGSSWGESRIYRREYKQPHYKTMMDRSHQLWGEVQKEADTQVLFVTGSVDMSPSKEGFYQDVIETAKINGVAYEEYTGKELKQKYPAFSHIPDETFVVYQPDAGIIHPKRATGMFQKLARSRGATLLDNQKVEDVKVTDDLVTVKTQDKTFQAKKLVACPGSWGSEEGILGKLGLKLKFNVWKMTTCYFKPKNAAEFKNLPWHFYLKEPMCFGVGLYSEDETNGYIKIGPFWCDDQNQNPNLRTFDPHQGTVEKLTEGKNFYFGDKLDEKPAHTYTCLQSMTADNAFIIDHHPQHKNVTIACGFSGHGFKFVPVIGEIVTSLTVDGKSGFDLSNFNLARVNDS